MAQRYLLPCEHCDQKIAVETTQAGHTVRCSGCSTEIKVGTLRDIKALSSADPGADSRTQEVKKSKMSATNRAIFVAASLLTVAGLIWGVVTTLDANQLSKRRVVVALSEKKVATLRQNLKSATPIEMSKMWAEIKPDVVAEWVEHPNIKIRKAIEKKRMYSWIAFSLAGIGLLGAVGSTVLTGKK